MFARSEHPLRGKLGCVDRLRKGPTLRLCLSADTRESRELVAEPLVVVSQAKRWTRLPGSSTLRFSFVRKLSESTPPVNAPPAPAPATPGDTDSTSEQRRVKTSCDGARAQALQTLLRPSRSTGYSESGPRACGHAAARAIMTLPGCEARHDTLFDHPLSCLTRETSQCSDVEPSDPRRCRPKARGIAPAKVRSPRQSCPHGAGEGASGRL